MSNDLANLSARATSEYAHKRYTPAAELYSQAVELQAEQNGEMAPQNADLLYAYGRCLYKAAVEKSDVLGGATKAEAGAEASKKRKADDIGEDNGARKKAKSEEPALETGNLQFEGDDEEWEEDDEDEDAAAEQNQEEEDDDFATAYEVLELARVLFERKLEAHTADDSAENDEETKARIIKESLSDIHDLQAEIHLESEQFTEAVNDARASLKYKEQLHSFESSAVAEAHFKLSLSLEFASKTVQPEPEGAEPTAPAQQVKVDEAGIKEATEQMKLAINSTKARLATLEASEGKQKDVTELKEVIAEMNERLQDLQQPPESLAAPKQDMAALIGGILGGASAEQSEELKKKLAEASAGATDLSSLVKKKVKKPEPDTK